jgi:uncharacterized protein YaiE (UPF0345 family)
VIKVNEYPEGKVKRLGFDREGIPYTAGVLMPGRYSSCMDGEEHLTVTLGSFQIRLSGAGWMEASGGQKVVIPQGVSFDLKVEAPASYLYMYR